MIESGENPVILSNGNPPQSFLAMHGHEPRQTNQQTWTAFGNPREYEFDILN